jgi:general secretion pathway protein A
VPDVKFFCQTPQYRDALTTLLNGIQNRRGFLALIGEAGTGKSLLLECALQQLDARSIEIGFLFNSKITPEQFFDLLAHDFALECARSTKSAILIALNDHLLARTQRGLTTALIVDNAQKLRPDVLEEIEMLGNLENRQGPLLQVVFAAQPNFEQQLEKSELRGLRQRILSRVRLQPLGAQELATYVAWRLAKVGLDQRVFPPEVLSQVHARTGGVPRLVNTLCSGILRICRADQRVTADLNMLNAMSEELALDRLADHGVAEAIKDEDVAK